jgi:hypothetical protein
MAKRPKLPVRDEPGATGPVSPRLRTAISGFCYPGEADSDIDAILRQSRLARRERILTEIRRLSNARHPLHPALYEWSEALQELPAVDAIGLFDDWWSGCLAAVPGFHATADVRVEVDSTHFLRWLLVSHAWHGPAKSFATAPGPPRNSRAARKPDVLYVPARHSIFDAGFGPVTAAREKGRVRLTSADGNSVVMPRADSLAPGGRKNGSGFRTLGFAASIPVLNGIPWLAELGDLFPASVDRLPVLTAVFEQGLQLLSAVWPDAYSFVERWLRGVVLLEPGGCYRSHSGPRVPEVIFCSSQEREKVAEVMCHEMAHVRMNALLAENAFLTRDGRSCHHSPWRKDLRPLIGLIHGIHAFLNVREYHRRLALFDSRYAAYSNSFVEAQTMKIRKAWAYVEARGKWTPVGERIAADLRAAVNSI